MLLNLKATYMETAVELQVLASFEVEVKKVITLEEFVAQNRDTFQSIHPGLVSRNFLNPCSVDIGTVLQIEILQCSSPMHYHQCMKYLSEQGGIFLGPLAIILAWEHREKFPIEKWVLSMDEIIHLYRDQDGGYRMPQVRRTEMANLYGFSLANVQNVLGSDSCLLLVRKKS